MTDRPATEQLRDYLGTIERPPLPLLSLLDTALAEAAQGGAPRGEGLPSLQPWVRHHAHCDAITDMDESSCDCGLNATLARLSRPSDEEKP